MIPRKPADRPNPAPGAAPVELPGAEEDLDRLAADVDRFKIEAERFLNGSTHVLPEELRTRIQRELRDLRQRNLKTAVEQFRLGSLEARYNSLSENFGRRLRELEEGRRPIPHPVPAGPRFDVASGVVLDEALDRDAVAALAAGIARHGAPPPDLETFRDYLGRQIAAVRAKTGLSRVQFRLAVEDGKAKLKAKPLGPVDPGAPPGTAEREPT